jgi:hypothetical protein
MAQNSNRHWTPEDGIRFRELLGLKPSRAGAARALILLDTGSGPRQLAAINFGRN